MLPSPQSVCSSFWTSLSLHFTSWNPVHPLSPNSEEPCLPTGFLKHLLRVCNSGLGVWEHTPLPCYLTVSCTSLTSRLFQNSFTALFVTMTFILPPGPKTVPCLSEAFSASGVDNQKSVTGLEPDSHRFSRPRDTEAPFPLRTELEHDSIYIWNVSCVPSLKLFSSITECWKKS